MAEESQTEEVGLPVLGTRTRYPLRNQLRKMRAVSK